MTNARAYWDNEFTTKVNHHSYQNKEISQDFIAHLTPIFRDTIKTSKSIIEIGCGSGEMSALVGAVFQKMVLGTDFSMGAISYAQKKNQNGYAHFKKFDPLTMEMKDHYDLAICSNTIEHFTFPFILVDKIFKFSDKVIILVPYDQPVCDGFDIDGGPGHVFQFTELSFEDRYLVSDSFTFKSNGWQHSSKGEEPLQLAVLLEKKNGS